MDISIEKLKEFSALLEQFIAFLEAQQSEEPIAPEPEPTPEPEPIPEPEPEPEPEPTIPLDTLVDQILDGQWGSGDTRKQKLIEAGYDYDVVQGRVNEILRVVQEVLDGKWGKGDERKERLIEAGYDYYVVQNEINRQLSKDYP